MGFFSKDQKSKGEGTVDKEEMSRWCHEVFNLALRTKPMTAAGSDVQVGTERFRDMLAGFAIAMAYAAAAIQVGEFARPDKVVCGACESFVKHLDDFERRWAETDELDRRMSEAERAQGAAR